jgi:hypothetical protein
LSRPPRSIVRVADSFFEQLDEQLGASRGPNGEPSSTDFLVMELPAVVERFAIDFDSTPRARRAARAAEGAGLADVPVHGTAERAR